MNVVHSEVAHPDADPASTEGAERLRGDEMAKDPVCGMVVPRASELQLESNGRTYYFCSSGCQRTFASPEQELKNSSATSPGTSSASSRRRHPIRSPLAVLRLVGQSLKGDDHDAVCR